MSELTDRGGVHLRPRATSVLVTGVLLLLLPPSTSAADETAFQFTREIEAPAIEQEELLSVTLDSSVYAATQDSLSDLRLVDAAENPVPFVIRRVQTAHTRTVRRTWTPRNVSVQPTDDGGLAITVELEEDAITPLGVRLVTPLENFEKRVRIETSADGQTWQAAAEALIFDYSRYLDVRQDRIPLPPTNDRQLRIRIDDVTAAQESQLLELTRRLKGSEETERTERFRIQRRPFRIDRLQFDGDIELEDAPTDADQNWPPLHFTAVQDDEHHQTRILIETMREPLTSITLQTPERNFSRLARVETADVIDQRLHTESIGRATLTRIDFKDLQREQLQISFPATRRNRLFVVIENRDSPPLEISGITARGTVDEIVFLATPGTSYRLEFGHPTNQPADLDTTAIQALLTSGYKPLPATWGMQRESSDTVARDLARWKDAINNPALLIAIIATLVVLLGFGLYHAVGRLDDDNIEPVPPPPE